MNRRRPIVVAALALLLLVGLALWNGSVQPLAEATPAPLPTPASEAPPAVAGSEAPVRPIAVDSPHAPGEFDLEPLAPPAHPVRLRCALIGAPVPNQTVTIITRGIDSDGELSRGGIEADVVDGELRVDESHPDGGGFFALDGGMTASLMWTTEPGSDVAHCNPILVVARPQHVRGVVVDTRGNPQGDVRVSIAYRSFDVTDAAGRFDIELSPAAQFASVIAQRSDEGALTAMDAVQIELDEHGAEDVRLVLPAGRVAGMGIQISKVPGGVRIGNVYDGSAASKAGLRTGDLVVELDGVAVDELSLSEFVALGTGEVDTQVDLMIERDSEAFDLTLTRAPVDEPG